MDDAAYLHRIEYSRRLPGGKLVREHVETVHDHGWYVVVGEEWKRRYTFGCAADFLERVHAQAGTYAVVVWRATDRVCAVGLEWRPSAG